MFGSNSEPVQLYRNCAAVLIPSGDEVILRRGTNGFITQALGGSFTVYVDGSLFRIDGGNADALGKDPVPPPQLPPGASREDLEKLVWEQMKTCFDPEIPINVVDLGLIYRCETVKLEDGQYRIEVDMTLTAPGCPVAGEMPQWVENAVRSVAGVGDVSVNLVFDPPWDMSRMSDEARLAINMF